MSGTRSHRPDQDDASAQSDLICVPQPIIIDQAQAAQIGGSARCYLPGFAWFWRPVMVQRSSGCPYVYSSAPPV